ncbi:MAG: short-chain dehydrogenase/reductase [Solirubrobacterales bacterium]|nr:short-chain dehydrogenase/reductase [Solirubrobacterales bacterium]
MTATLITGANKGLGLEVASRLLADGHDVWVAARDESLGRAAAEDLGARFVQLDVTDDASVAAAAATVAAASGLDVLINNAGIVGAHRAVEDITPQDIADVFATNVLGIVRVTQAFLALLRRSGNPVIVNVSSGMGSLAVTSDPERLESTLVSLGYATSKAAVNMLSTQYAKALPGMRVNAVDPGYTATDLNGHRGTQTVEQGAEVIVAMAKIDATGPTASFSDRHGLVPW